MSLVHRTQKSQLIETYVTTAPATEPVTLAEVKLWAKIDLSDDDTLIDDLITGVRQDVERYLNRSLITQTRVALFDAGQINRLPYSDVISITSATYVDVDNTTTALTDGVDYYSKGDKQAYIYIPSPLNQQLKVTYTCGYGTTASDVPLAIRDAIISIIADRYENRQNTDKATNTLVPNSHYATLQRFKNQIL